jgi:cytochrome subunit of sulfide dehydrogenase
MSWRLPIAHGWLIAIMLAPIAAHAAVPATTRHARAIAATCTTCHVRGGARTPAIVPLEGRPAASLVDAMRAFKAGSRGGTVMPQIARGYADADIDALAAWFAAQR